MTPDSDYSFQQLEQHFPNHWLIFDHHESEEKLRQKYRQNCIIPTNTDINPSATSLVWDWVSQNVNFSNIPSKRQNDLHYLVELIRAYDTWDWKNDGWSAAGGCPAGACIPTLRGSARSPFHRPRRGTA